MKSSRFRNPKRGEYSQDQTHQVNFSGTRRWIDFAITNKTVDSGNKRNQANQCMDDTEIGNRVGHGKSSLKN